MFQGSWSDAIRATGHHLRRRNWPKSVVFVRKLPAIILPTRDRPQRRARGREIDVPEERLRLQYAMELAEFQNALGNRSVTVKLDNDPCLQPLFDVIIASLAGLEDRGVKLCVRHRPRRFNKVADQLTKLVRQQKKGNFQHGVLSACMNGFVKDRGRGHGGGSHTNF